MGSKSRARRLIVVAACVVLAVAVTILAQGTTTTPVTIKIDRLKVTVTFDLVSQDPAVAFDVTLVVTDAAGRRVHVQPTSVTGDVNRVAPGRRTLTWDAGKDSDFPPLDDYKYAVDAVAVILTGKLSVQTDPAGVIVTVDGRMRGTTGASPLMIEDLRIGPHEVILSKPGYIENRVGDQSAQIRAGETTTVTRTLTALPATPVTAPGGTSSPTPPKGGGIPKWIIPVAGGGAAAALLGLKGKASTAAGGAGACVFSLSPASFSSPTQAGGSATVTIGVSPAGCSPQTWTTVDGAFMTVSPSSGTGAGNVTVTLQANNTVAARSGSATIAGIAFATTNQPGLPSVTGPVSGNTATFSAFTGITVVAGQKLTITASGTVCTNSPGCTVNASPNGSGTGNAGSAGRLPGAPSHALICGIAGQAVGDLFFVGSSFTTTAAVGGQLFCGLNEPNGIQSSYDDNTGTWTITVTIGG